jgi:hypothetical protein
MLVTEYDAKAKVLGVEKRIDERPDTDALYFGDKKQKSRNRCGGFVKQPARKRTASFGCGAGC